MRSILVPARFLTAVLAVWGGLFFFVHAQAASVQGKNGSVILRMCKGAQSVKMLSVMCQGYLDGYLDAAHHYAKGRPTFCLADGDRREAPGAVVEWIESHPESLTQPAGEVLQKALAERFPCRGRN